MSGGLDSTTVLAIARAQGFQCYCLSFDYGQRQSLELERARGIADRLAAQEHLVLNIDLGRIGDSALTADIEVPKGRGPGELAGEIPVTYVPAKVHSA